MNRSEKRDLGVEAGGERAQIITGHWEVTWSWWPKRDEDVTSPDGQWRTFLTIKKWANAKALKCGDARKFPRRLINGRVGFSGGIASCMVGDEIKYQMRPRRAWRSSGIYWSWIKGLESDSEARTEPGWGMKLSMRSPRGGLTRNLGSGDPYVPWYRGEMLEE